MYIARSVAAGYPLESPSQAVYQHMPTLSEGAKKIYIQAYGENTYERYCDTAKTFHGSDGALPNPRKLPNFKFCHRPDHDVESIFWVLLATLLRARPVNSTATEADLKAYCQAEKVFQDHRIQEGVMVDNRECLLNLSLRQMETALDPELRDLGWMLMEMAEQVKPEYGYLSPAPPNDHLHEAMRRLLLEQILRMDDEPGIPLQAGTPRLPPDDGGNTRKRKSQQQGGADGKRSKLSTQNLNRRDRSQFQPDSE